MKNLFMVKILLILFFALSGLTAAQELRASAGADLVSRYIWRGIEINNTPNIQPSIALGAGGFEIGLWGSYTLSNQTFATDEIDLYLSYGFSTDAGDFVFLLTDYYFPNSGTPLGHFQDNGGAHTLELGAVYNGPVSFALYYNFYNDPGNNIYFEIGYSFAVSGIDFGLIAGGTSGSKDNPVYYGSDGFALINLGISVSKEVIVTDKFGLPLSASFIVNPNDDIAHLVFGCSFSL
ncbi:MAG: hypothetical protein JW995_02865 [Melioribacteraceae bacterium]|nr:hypothetical protein [Melioribacteraceae bacterium]